MRISNFRALFRGLGFALTSLILLLLTLVSCKDDGDSGPQPTGTSTQYSLNVVGGSGVSGSATFELLDNNATRITLSLNGTSSGGDHPSHIHMNSAAEGGGIILDLTNVNGASGESVTEVTELNDGTPISYEELIAIDGYINVHNSSSDLGTLLAQGDVGVNVLTDKSMTYPLSSVSDPAISGEAVFSERMSGETLVEVMLTGAPEGGDYPSHIHMNAAAEGGGIAIDLNNVVDGYARTHVASFNDGTPVTYNELIAYDGYINVHNADNLSILMAQGDIGINAITEESVTYTLNPVTDESISGTATFSKRVNNETLVVIELTGAPEGSSYPSHIHMNSASEGGGIVIDLNNVVDGLSKTNITEFNDGTTVTYQELLVYDGYINVHDSENLSILMAQGNIGSNFSDDGGGEEPDPINYDVTNSGATAYVFNGNDLTDASNPDITLVRGQTYTFTMDAPGHPFYIKDVQGVGTSDAYDSGVSNNGSSSGVITFEVPNDAPDQLFYNCEFHGTMTGVFTITD